MGGNRRWILAGGLILAVGVLIRIPIIAEPYSTFHPARNFRDAVVARDLTYRLWGAPSPELAERSAIAVEEWGPIEPPVLESMSAVLKVAEPEDLWRGRLLVVAFYLGGVAYLALALGRVLRPAAGIAALVIGALLPYGIVASPSFQPDPMVAGLLCAAFGVLLRRGADGGEQLSRRGHVAVGVLGGLAGVMKHTALPIIGLAYLWVHRDRWRSRDVLLGTALMGAPSVLWLLNGLVFGDSLDSQTGNRILPELLTRRAFWNDWRQLLDGAFTLPLVAVALAGAFLSTPFLRRLVLGGFAGYCLVGLTFPFLMATHDYYHLILLPVVTIGGAAFVHELPRLLPSVRPALLSGLGVAAGVVVLIAAVQAIDRHLDSGLDRAAAVAEPYIGFTTDEAVAFTRDDGIGLEYLTRARVFAWPNGADLSLSRAGGDDPLTGQPLLDQHRADGVRWFVFTVPTDLADIPELVELLAPFEVVECLDDAIVVDLDEEVDGPGLPGCVADLDIELDPDAGS